MAPWDAQGPPHAREKEFDMITVICPHCKHGSTYPDHLLNKTEPCLHCAHHLTVTPRPTLPEYSPLARIVLAKGVVTHAQLTYALKVQEMAKVLGKTHALDSILYRLGFISLHALHRLFEASVRFIDREFEKIALEKKLVTPESMQQAKAIQATELKKSRLFQMGKILLSQKSLTKEQYDHIMFHCRNKELLCETTPPLDPTPNDGTPNRKVAIMGMIAVEEQLVDPVQLENILKELDNAPPDSETTLDTLLLNRKLIAPDKLQRLLEATERILDQKFIALALQREQVTQAQVHQAILIQAQENPKRKLQLISDILVSKGVLTLAQCNEILRYQGRQEKDKKAATRRIRPQLYKRLKHGVAFGKMVMENGYISQAQLREALTSFKDCLNAGKKTSMDEILVMKNMVSPSCISTLRMIKSITDIGVTDKRFGEMAIELQLVKGNAIRAAFRQQLEEFKITHKIRSISEILVLNKRLSGHDAKQIHRMLIEDEQGVEAPPPSQPTAETPRKTAQGLPEGIRGLLIEISDDGMSASLTIPEPLVPSMTYAYLQQLAADAGITFGLVDADWFKALLEHPDATGTTVLVAHGREPAPGRQATIVYHFETDHLRAGDISKDGRIDYRHRGRIPFVSAGSLLAEFIPPVNDTPGVTVRGEALEAPLSSELSLTAGPGTASSPDGASVYAAQDGYPQASLDGTISVVQEYRIDGDVGLRTGHVVFNGNITITGTVQEGFRVQGNHVTARFAKGAVIEATSGLLITEGIIDSTIKVGASLRAKYISNSRIEAFGDIVVTNEIMDSTIRVSGRCINKQGEIINSGIASLKGFLVRNVGTDVSQPCHLRLGVSEHITGIIQDQKNKFTAAKTALTDEQRRLHALEAELVTLQGTTAALVSQQEHLLRVFTAGKIESNHDAQGELKAIEAQIKANFKRDDDLSEEISAIKQTLIHLESTFATSKKTYTTTQAWAKAQEATPKIQALGTLMEGTVLTSPRSRRVLTETLHNIRLQEYEAKDGSYTIA